MYFPYLRGKQFEFLAVRELAQKGLLHKNNSVNVIPIFEPVKNNFNYFDEFITSNIIFGIVVNPKVGEFSNNSFLISKYINENINSNFYVCILVNAENETEVLYHRSIYQDSKKIYIHNEYNQNLYNQLHLFNDGSINFISKSLPNDYFTLNNKVIFEDSFYKADRNSDYPIESYFNNNYSTYKQLGYIGVSDYLTIGDTYSETGGLPLAVAIHLSIEQKDAVYIKHFVSDSIEKRGDVSVKFTQAVTKLVNFVIQNNITHTEGIKEFLNWANTDHFPNLGPVKKASMKNHIELLNKLI